MTQEAWWQDAARADRYLRRLAQDSGLRVADDGSTGAGSVPMPVGGPQPVTVRLDGGALRAVAHRVVAGPTTSLLLRNLNAINEVPWGGHVYPAAQGDGVDLAVGLPLPASDGDDERPVLLDLLGVLRSSAAQVRAGSVPGYTGPAGTPAPTAVRQAADALRSLGGAVAVAEDGRRADTLVEGAGGGVPVVLFAADDGVLAARGLPGDALVPGGDDDLLAAIARWNAGSSTGAVVWSSEVGVLFGVCSYPHALVRASAASVAWLLAGAAEAGDAARDLAAAARES